MALDGLRELPSGCYLSLNASPATLLDPRLEGVLTGVDASRIVFEVTEHDDVVDYDAFVTALGRLRDFGARIALDDFGAGFASFRHMVRIRPDIVKVDRSIVAGIDTDPAQQAAITAIRGFVRSNNATLPRPMVGCDTGGSSSSPRRLKHSGRSRFPDLQVGGREDTTLVQMSRCSRGEGTFGLALGRTAPCR